MAMTDWNWFFASIAQAVGALVGVLIAFLIATITAARGRFEANKATTRNLLLNAQRLQSELSVRPFEWYNELSLRLLVRDVKTYFTDDYDNDAPLREPEYYMNELSPHAFMPRSEIIAAVAKIIKEEDERRRAEERRREEETKRADANRQAEELRKSNPLLYGSSFLAKTPYVPPPFIPSALSIQEDAARARESRAHLAQQRRDLDDEFDAVKALFVAVEHHIRLIKAHLPVVQANSDQTSLAAKAIVVAALLFALGVIFPLMLTPVPTEGSEFVSPWRYFELTGALGIAKSATLIVSGVLFTWLLVTLGRENARLRPDETDAASLMHWLDLNNYSKYLAHDEPLAPA